LVAGEENKIKIFGLDRISGLHKSMEKSAYPKDFSLDSYFEHCYGIVRLPNTEPQVIVIWAIPIKAAFYKANPLHSSQKVVEETADYTLFSLFVYFTYDLQQEIRSHGEERVKIIKPENELKIERYS